MRVPALIALILFVAGASLAATAYADEAFSVVIDGRSGEMALRNDGPTAVNVDGYLVRSPSSDVFNPAAWSSLEDNAIAGWSESMAMPNRFGEANLFGSMVVAAGHTVSIGSPYQPFVPTAIGQQEPGLDSINFSYSVSGMGAFAGDVEFLNRNTVVLKVDPTSGAASLENQSVFDINLDSYLIRSSSSALDAGGWAPLEESLGGAGGWRASAGAINRIAEGNLFGSTFLAANGGSLSLGTPINPSMLSDEADLDLEFTVVGMDAIDGGVQFSAAAAPAVPGDYNGNGTVDAADYVLWRNGGPLLNEGVTPGNITPEDYTFWRSRFGASSGAGSNVLVAEGHAVPEPVAALMIAPCLTAAGWRVWKRRRQTVSG